MTTMIPVLCRTTNRRDGTWLHGHASPDCDWRDVVRGATFFASVDRVQSAVVIKSKRGKPRHWLITVRDARNAND